MQKYGKLPENLVVTNLWEVLYVDLIGLHILKGNGRTQIDYMCVTMLDLATSWFEIAEVLVSENSLRDIPRETKGHNGTKTHKHDIQPYFNKTSATVGTLIKTTQFCRYPCSQYTVIDNGS